MMFSFIMIITWLQFMAMEKIRESRLRASKRLLDMVLWEPGLGT
jgi:hypothetical protein